MTFSRFFCVLCVFCGLLRGHSQVSAGKSRATLEKTFVLAGTDLRSIGSGLAKSGQDEFIGITDHVPGSKRREAKAAGATEPCPTLVRFKLENGQIRVTQSLPLSDRHGAVLSGARKVDLEAVRVFPNGTFLLSEEESPSLLVVATNGEVLVRYTPKSKPLPNAGYLVKPILPDVFAERRPNRGFECVALSKDGHFAYALSQSPLGDPEKKRYSASRMIRVLKLDVSRPLEATLVGEYLAPVSRSVDYPGDQKQDKLSWSDAEWMAPDQLLVIERGKELVKLLIVDLSRATNVLERRDEGTLVFEDARTNLAALGVQPAAVRELCSTRDFAGIKSDKLEGVAILDSTHIALANDNDFGAGTGRPKLPRSGSSD